MSSQASPKPVTPIPRAPRRVGSLARLRDECRQAKERLSAETATVVPVELPGFNSDVRVTRTELENLISGPLAGLLAAIEETLQRNNIPVANISAVATVGGGANIPLATQQLSERLRAPVVTTPQSQLNVAAGAALVADAGLAAGCADRNGGGRGRADEHGRRGLGRRRRGTGRNGVGLRRRGLGDIPGAGVVAGRFAGR